MSLLGRIFHRHTWRIVGVQHGTFQYIWGTPGGAGTLVQRRCTDCGRISSEEIHGHWTYMQLTGRNPE